MENYRQANSISFDATSAREQPGAPADTRSNHPKWPGSRPLIGSWHTFSYLLFSVLLLLLTTLVVVIYYLNHHQAEPLSDTWSYLYVVDRIQSHGQVVNFWRLPGYPLFIVLVYSLMGQGNLANVSTVQAILFVLATLEIYVLAALVLRRPWAAFIIALLVGINIPLLSYVKPIMSEAMALWLLASLALAVGMFLSTLQLRTFWLVTLCMLLLFLTRPEWMYLPVLLFAYLLLVALWRGMFRRLLPHVLLSLMLLYGVLGIYLFINTTQNDFAGVTWIQNINELGKVLQYHMQDEAPPQYAGVSHILDGYVSKGIIDPYTILAQQPSLSGNGAALAGAYAQSIIEHHPVQFLRKSVRVFFSSLTIFYDESSVAPTGPFGSPLTWLESAFRALYKWNIFFPLCAGIWLCLLCLPRLRRLLTVQIMGAIVLLGLYGLVTTTLGAYRGFDYMRIHTLFDPLMILVMGGTLLMGALLTIQQGPALLVWLANRSFLFRLLLLALLMAVMLSGCAWQESHSPPDLIPTACHREPGVGLFFVTIENHGGAAGPSTMRVEYETNSLHTPRVNLDVRTPNISSGAQVFIAVDLPFDASINSFLLPTGKVTITVDARKELAEANKANNVLVTDCNDVT